MARSQGPGAVASACLFACAIGAASYSEATTFREAAVTRVIDGDTFAVIGEAYPRDCGASGQKRFCDTNVRVRNFDTAELRDYGCPEERQLAVEARAVAAEILAGARVTLIVEGEDRFGRPVADVIVHRGGERVDFVEAMVARGAGARWRYGDEPQPEWCPAGRRVAGEGGFPTWRDVQGWAAQAMGRWFGSKF